MAETIEVEVGELHANLHEQLEGMVGDEYNQTVRNQLEELIHNTYRQVERQQEEQDSIEQKLADGDVEIETEE